METNKIISTFIKSERIKMKKKTFVAIILFCVFSHIYAQDKWIEIAGTQNKNLTETDIDEIILSSKIKDKETL